MFPVLIMNILISVLSVWLDYAIKNVWLDFQQARARRVLRYKAMLFCLRRKELAKQLATLFFNLLEIFSYLVAGESS